MELVIQGTLDLIEEKQTVRITARDIAKQVGYTPGTLYTHFKNLDDIFLHVNARSLREMRGHIETAIAEETDPASALVTMGLTYLNFARAHRYRFQAMFTPRLPESVSPPVYLQQEIDQLFGLLSAQLAQIAPTNEETLELGARALWSGVHGVASLAIADQLFTPRPKLEHRLVETQVRQFVAAWPIQD